MSAVPKRDPTMEWLARTDLSRYGGKYVAIVACRVVASGKDPRKVLAQAHKRHPRKEATLMKVPTEDLLIL